MKKTIKINISSLVFNVDEDAFDRLSRYLDKLQGKFNGTPGESEIMSDIESRIAEIFQERVSDDKQVVNLEDVNEAIGILGEPEDITAGEEESGYTEAEPGSGPEFKRSRAGRRRLFRDPENEVVGGVCGGIGEYFGMDPVIIRILFVVFTLLWGTGLLIYILLWIVVPEAKTTAERLEMRGERINVSNIEKSIRKEYAGIKENIQSIPDTEAYRKTRSGMGGLGRALGQIFVTIIKVIGIIIGASFVFAGIALLVGILGGLLAGQTWLMGDMFDWKEFGMPQVLGLFVDESVAILALICILIVVAIPILALIYGGVKLLFPFRAHDKAIGISGFGVWIVALVLLAVFALSEGVKYNDFERETQQVELKLPTDKLYFMVGQSDFDDKDVMEMDFGYHQDLTIVEDGRKLSVIGTPIVDIVRTDRNTPELKIRRESRGVNESAAERFAEDIEFGYTLKDSFLIIDPYFELGKNNKWRGQELDVILYLPDGYRIFIDESAREYLVGIDNQENLWSEMMVGKEWIMEKDGLRRLDKETD